MSDEDIFEDSDDGDFSASEDEWAPGKEDDTSESDFEETINDSAELESTTVQKAKIKSPQIDKIKKHNTKRSTKKASLSLRMKLYNKYKPPPKTVKTVSQVASSVASTSKSVNQSTSRTGKATKSDSSSSDDDNFVNPDELDLRSPFFDKNNTQSQGIVPNFDCNAGINFTDSGTNDDNDDSTDSSSPSSQTKVPGTTAVLNQFQAFTENLERAKSQFQKASLKPTNSSQKSNDNNDISKLLSLGEGVSTSTIIPTKRRKKDYKESDDSDWEEVEDDDSGGIPLQEHQIKDVEIMVGEAVLPRKIKNKKSQDDLEAIFKRKMNQRIREVQFVMHKIHIIGWIGFGNYANRVLNNLSLMNMALKLLPSKQSYPDGPSCEKYYQSIVKWFGNKVVLKSRNTYCHLSKLPPLGQSLALQIRGHHAICYRDFVFIFVTLIRAIGLQCRLVMNFQTVPKRPAQSDLMALSTKDPTGEKNSSSKDSKEKTNSKRSGTISKPGTSASGSNTTREHSKETSKASSSRNKSTEKSKQLSPQKHYPANSKNSSASKHLAANKNTSPTNVLLTSKHSDGPKSSFNDKKLSKHKQQSSQEKPSAIVKEKNKQIPKGASHATTMKAMNEKTYASEQIIKKQVIKPTVESNSPHFSDRNVNSPKQSRTVLTKRKIVDETSQGTPPKKPAANKNSNAAAVLSPKVLRSRKVVRNIVQNKTTTTAKSSDETVPSTSAPKQPKQMQPETVFSPKLTRKRRAEMAEQGKKLNIPQMDGAHDDVKKRGSSAKRKIRESKRRKCDENSDSDFEPNSTEKINRPINFNKIKKTSSNPLDRVKHIDRRVFSTDEEDNEISGVNVVNKSAMNFWPEVYCEKEQKWITVDLLKAKVNAVQSISTHASKPLLYVFAWNNNNKIRDVTPRYNSKVIAMRKARVDQDWLDETLAGYTERKNTFNMIEDIEFSKISMEQPLPTAIGDFKNHPLYALERHLLKFEGIYPPDAPTLGFIRGEPIYARECVHMLHSREIWVKQARVVKLGETPYKVVKARPKWDRQTNKCLEAQPLEIFGFWQTKPYEPPVAENGVVPRNPYGNVELFKPEMLPIGTRHLQLPGLQKTCKKMNVDCAVAVTGFDFHSGGSHPVFDGFVVCEEFADAVVEQWWEDQQEAERKEQEKIQARVWGNWKKLIKGLLIRERLKRKYNYTTVISSDVAPAPTTSSVTSKRK